MLTLLEASKEVGKTKQALLKSIQKGTISAQKNQQNRWIIDPSELFRVYPQKKVGGKSSNQFTDNQKNDSLTFLIQKNETLNAERIESFKKIHELEVSYLKERNMELKEELKKVTQILLEEPKKLKEEREKKDQIRQKVFLFFLIGLFFLSALYFGLGQKYSISALSAEFFS